MSKNYVSNSPESVRIFKSNFMESLSKVHFSVPLFLYIPVISFFIYSSIVVLHTGLLMLIAFYIAGIVSWSIIEYLLHRYIFHFKPKGMFWERIHFIFHGVHHDYPNDAKRLVMPPSVSLPLALLFYGLFSLLLSKAGLHAFFPGFVTGYLIYDISHYALHHFNFKSTFWRELKKHHMLHHYQDSNKRYGVSSVFWDKIFGSDA